MNPALFERPFETREPSRSHTGQTRAEANRVAVMLGVATLFLSVAVATGASAASGPSPAGTGAPSRARVVDPGFIVLAPDRGFLGNEETRDAFEALAAERNAALVFVTDERTRRSMAGAVQRLAEAGARRAVVVPFFLSAADSRLSRARTLGLEDLAADASAVAGSTGLSLSIPLSWGRAFGESYFAVEVLADRLREIPDPAGRRVVVVGDLVPVEKSRDQMERDVRRIAEGAAEGFGFESVQVVVEPGESEARESVLRALDGGPRPVVVPFHLGQKLDGMMAFTASIREALPPGVDLVDGEVTPHPAVAMWMLREANRCVPIRPEEVGVVVLAHGADYHWNETMREAVQPLSERYAVELALCMADPPVVERAIRRLERRGVRGIVIVRVFGLESSFRSAVERMVGLDVEMDRVPSEDGADAHHHGHGHGHGDGAPGSAPPPRIRTAAVVTTVGGLEDHKLFAEALAARARALSSESARETVILVAHGAGEDDRNEHWLGVLASLANQMRAGGGADFRAIHAATWREDWPDKREPCVARMRDLVKSAREGGGRALVIPARTNGHGPEPEFLEGLEYALGEGFAPHPLFARWVEEQVREGIEHLQGRTAASAHGSGDDDHAPARAERD